MAQLLSLLLQFIIIVVVASIAYFIRHYVLITSYLVLSYHILAHLSGSSCKSSCSDSFISLQKATGKRPFLSSFIDTITLTYSDVFALNLL